MKAVQDFGIPRPTTCPKKIPMMPKWNIGEPIESSLDS